MSGDRISAAEKVVPYRELTKLTPELAEKLIKRIVIYPDESIRIEWNFSDELCAAADFPENRFERPGL